MWVVGVVTGLRVKGVWWRVVWVSDGWGGDVLSHVRTCMRIVVLRETVLFVLRVSSVSLYTC